MITLRRSSMLLNSPVVLTLTVRPCALSVWPLSGRFRAARSVRQVRRLELVLRQALLREIQKYVLAQHTGAFHFRHDRQRFEASLNRVGKVVQIAIGVLVTRYGLKRWRWWLTGRR